MRTLRDCRARVETLMLVFAVLSLVGNAQIWGIKGPDTSGSTPRRWVLFWFHENGSGITFVGNVMRGNDPVKIDGLAFAPSHGLLAFEIDGDLYAYGGSNSRLVRIDPNTAQVSAIGSWLSRRSIHGAAFDLQGRLWAVDSINGELLQIDPATGAVLTSVPLTYQGNRVYPVVGGTDIAFDISGTAYLSDAITAPPYGTRYFRVDLQTGVMTLLWTDTQVVPGPAVSGPAAIGIAFSRVAPNQLFMFNGNNEDNIWYYELTSGWNRIYLYDVLSYNRGGYNSGPGDLASYIGCIEHNGDVDNNGCVDDADLLAVLFAFGDTGQALGRVDTNCDGTVDDADLLTVLFNFGSGC